MSDTFSFDGTTVDVATVANDVNAQLRTGSVWSAPDDWSNADGIIRLLDHLHTGAIEQAVVRAVLRATTDGELATRQQAVAVIGEASSHFPVDALLQLLHGQAHLFRGIPKSEGSLPLDLEAALWQALAEHPHLTQPALEALRHTAVRSDFAGDAVLGPLTRRDPTWVRDHAPHVLAGHARRAIYMIFNAPDEQTCRQFFEALAHESPEVRNELIEVIVANCDDPDARRLIDAIKSAPASEDTED